ncbi:MAG: M23 family metallopeptidase [Clostridiales bacterium]|nr:M23 family metallopeptidase [Clostridiales bacterium]
MKEKSTSKKKLIYYIVLGVSVLLLIAATVLTVYFVVNGNREMLEVPPQQEQPNKPDDNKPNNPDDNKPNNPDDNKPTGGDAVKFSNPLAAVSVQAGFEFYENKTLGWFYEHEGVDITARAGEHVFAMADGTIESITVDETLVTEIVVNHGNGVKTVYCQVEAVSGLKAGDKVVKGQPIATVVDGKGNEYKDGAHLHLEVMVNSVKTDPMEYLTLSEK